MMDLRVSVVLLFFFLSGGYSLKCYSCEPDSTGFCDEKVEICQAGFFRCGKSVTEQSGFPKVAVEKGCLPTCAESMVQIADGTMSLHCCKTNLCNAADGVYKGSFLLLVSPLLFYFLFQ